MALSVTKKRKEMKVSIEKQKDGTYVAYNTDGDKVVLLGTGNTVTEAKEDFFDSVSEVRESYLERGGEVPAELLGDVEFKFDLSSLFEYYSMLNITAIAKYIGINGALMRQYKKGDTYISEARLAQIEEGIHRLGSELAALKLV